MVGMAQLASAPDCGSGGRGFESLYPPFFFIAHISDAIGLSPSGKALLHSLVRIQLAQLLKSRLMGH